MATLTKAADYQSLYAGFRWDIPADFNIGTAVCTRWAERDAERVAIIHRSPDGATRNVTYGELEDASNRLANALRSAGIKRGDRVALLLPQCPQTAIAHIAIYKLGAIAVPLALLFGVEALTYRLNNCGAKGLITCAAGMTKIEEISEPLPGLDVIMSIDGGGDALDFDSESAKAKPEFTPEDTGPDDPAMMIYTSGTTGPPKGALHGHRVLLGHLPGVQMPHEFFPQPGDLIWTPADWAWAGGLLNILLPGLYFGVPVLSCPMEKFDPEFAFALCGEFGVRNAFIPPTALRIMRAVKSPATRYNLQFRTIGSGGESLGKEAYDWAKAELGLSINEFYGQTECNLVLASCSKLGIVKPGAIGVPVPGHTVGIIDDSGQLLPAGQSGQIAVKRPDPVMFLEYWQNPEATKKKFIGDWMMTGDQGMMDDEGYIHFVGRDDDVITSAGYRIGPGEIEDCLIGHPAVALAAAVGKPDPVRTEIVKAFVVLRDGQAPSDALANEIQLYVRKRLSAHEYPREIEFRDSLPLTTTGKVIRRLLRES